MARRADAGRSGALMRGEKRASMPKGPGKGSRDIGEPAGQMKQKSVKTSPQAKHDQVSPEAPAGRVRAPRERKP